MNLVMRVLGIVSPGAMGSALGAAALRGGLEVVAVTAGRSERTRALAAEAGLAEVSTLEELLDASDVVLSVVPPGEADAVADNVVGALATVVARPLLVDCNAIRPERVRGIAARVAAVGVDCVDGSISGPPPRGDGSTVLYLSGPRATEVEQLPLDGVVRRVVGDEVGLASAVKMSTASVYKGRVALLTQALRAAHENGVVDHVLADLVRTGLADEDRTGETVAAAAAKAWRYVAEMEEIAATQADAALTPTLFEAIAAVYTDLAERTPFDHPDDVPANYPLRELLDLFRAKHGSGAPREDQ